MSKLTDFVGSSLTHGTFHQMTLEVMKQITLTDHELNKESSEFSGFIAGASLADNLKALQALGLANLHHRIVARVNAVAELDSTPEVEAFIAHAHAIADHYRIVMANQAKKSAAADPAVEIPAAGAAENK